MVKERVATGSGAVKAVENIPRIKHLPPNGKKLSELEDNSALLGFSYNNRGRRIAGKPIVSDFDRAVDQIFKPKTRYATPTAAGAPSFGVTFGMPKPSEHQAVKIMPAPAVRGGNLKSLRATELLPLTP